MQTEPRSSDSQDWTLKTGKCKEDITILGLGFFFFFRFRNNQEDTQTTKRTFQISPVSIAEKNQWGARLYMV